MDDVIDVFGEDWGCVALRNFLNAGPRIPLAPLSFDPFCRSPDELDLSPLDYAFLDTRYADEAAALGADLIVNEVEKSAWHAAGLALECLGTDDGNAGETINKLRELQPRAQLPRSA